MCVNLNAKYILCVCIICVGDRPTIRQLVEVMRIEDFNIATHWYDLGYELLDNAAIVDVIEVNYPYDVTACCRMMFQKWLERSPNASWSQLITALRNIEMITAAYSINKLFKSSM